MKKIFLLLFFLPLLSFSQNYEFVKTDGTYLFGNNYAYRIDSIITADSGQLLYSYRRVFTVVNDYEGILDPNTSWLGTQILLNNEGRTQFYNRSNQPFVLNSDYAFEEEWTAFHYNNGNNIKARFTGAVEWLEILPDLFDSVKLISFQAYNSSNEPISHAINDKQIRLSKSNGMLDAFYFVSINQPDYSSFNLQSISGIELQSETFGTPYFFPSMVSSLEINSTMHFISYVNYEDYDPTYIIRTVMDKVVSENYCTYTYLDSISYQGVFTTNNHSEKWNISALPYESLFPNDSINFQGYMQYNGIIYDDPVYGKTRFGYHYWHGQDNNYQGDYTWFIDYCELNQCNEFAYSFIENVGHLTTGKGEGWSGDELVYYKNSMEEWGTPFQFTLIGTHDLVNSNIDISPNPSKGLFNFQSSKKIEELKVFNINGQLVWQINELNKNQIDLSALPEGLYMIKIQLEDNQVINEKIMIQK